MPLSDRALVVAILALSGVMQVACSDDPTGPPIPSDAIRFEPRNWFNFDPIRGVDEGLIEFQVLLSDTHEADVSEIQAMAVRFPMLAPKIPIPVDFQPRGDGMLAARTTYDRGAGLTIGEYTLEVEFVTGDTAIVVTDIEHRGINAPEILDVVSLDGSASVRWHAPSVFHTWRVLLERYEEATEVELQSQTGSSQGGGIFQVGFEFDRDPAAVYALTIVITSSDSYRRWVVPL